MLGNRAAIPRQRSRSTAVGNNDEEMPTLLPPISPACLPFFQQHTSLAARWNSTWRTHFPLISILISNICKASQRIMLECGRKKYGWTEWARCAQHVINTGRKQTAENYSVSQRRQRHRVTSDYVKIKHPTMLYVSKMSAVRQRSYRPDTKCVYDVSTIVPHFPIRFAF